MNRREFLESTVTLTAAAVSSSLRSDCSAAERPKRKFKMTLNVGQVGVKADPFEAIKLAQDYGYESVTPMPGHLLRYSESELARLVGEMKTAGLTWGAAGVRSFFVNDDTRFNERKQEIIRTAKLLQGVGGTRCFTWTMPSSDNLMYMENFRLHVKRLREAGNILADHGLRLGIEYLGTRMLAVRGKYPFIRTSAETRRLTAEVGLVNVGIALDSWHWFQAGETEEDILKLANQDVVTADICDAPADIPRERMPDSPRKLPCTTGVIDVKAFLRGLVKIGYDGPVGTEPFVNSLKKMSTEEAMATATGAMKKAFSLIE
jgi:sugar phosphate isomerase/epimerase